ncbi:MAG: ATP-grasp domain-containing protein [Bacteroidota bacterium]
MKNVLILSATASAINYKNSLAGDSRYRLFMTDVSPYAAGFYDERIIPLLIPRARDNENYRKALETIIEQYKIDILIPTSDHDMEGVAFLLKQGWNPPVSMFRFDPEKFSLYTHKSKLARALEVSGFDSIRSFSESDSIEFPVVVKPSREGGSKGVWIVDNQSDYEQKISLIRKQYGKDLVIQEYIPGGTGSIYVVLLLYGQDKRLYGEVVTQSSLTYMTWGGGGNAGNIVENPDLLDHAKKILGRLGGWQGPINMEFKRHAGNGRYYLMEINCRLNGYSYLNSMNGLNFPKAALELLEKGTTSFITSRSLKERKNFVIGYREQIVADWVR